MTDNEIKKEIQEIKESMKRHIDLTNEMGQDLLRIDAEYTGGSKVWLTTDFFKKVVKHFCHSNYLVKCLELVFEYINRLQAENERLIVECGNQSTLWSKHFEGIFETAKETIKAEAVKEFAKRLKAVSHPYADTQMVFEVQIDNLLKELVGEDK